MSRHGRYWADTGNEGRSRGIHVHVDVVAPGPSPYPGCWRNNYINPAKVVRDNTLSGTWYWDGPASQSEVHWQEIHLNMSEGTGSGYRLFKTSVSRRYCDILKSSSYHATLNGNKDATFMFTYQPGKCTINQEGCAGAPRARCIVVDTPGSYPMKLVNENTLEVGNYKFKKGGFNFANKTKNLIPNKSSEIDFIDHMSGGKHFQEVKYGK